MAISSYSYNTLNVAPPLEEEEECNRQMNVDQQVQHAVVKKLTSVARKLIKNTCALHLEN
jgi:hypothetical protein